MLKNTSIVTVDAPEFIKVIPCNDLISQCEIKVLYLGENRNRSFITKDVAKQMANSLPGMPIVAAYRKEIDDFGDHGHVVTIEDGEIKFSCKTVPYGFIAPDAKIWFQKFLDIDENGVQTEREYLMTTGYLWTGQYPEIQKAIDEGLPQSMELCESNLDGYWSTDNKTGIDFFIINDATFTKLCVLGSDVEPCFEGAAVTAPKISKEFTVQQTFVEKLMLMKQELNYALLYKGGSEMNKQTEVQEELPVVQFEDSADSSDTADNASDNVDASSSAADDTVVDESNTSVDGEDIPVGMSEEGSDENATPSDNETSTEEEEEDEDSSLISMDVSSRKRTDMFAKDEEENEQKSDDDSEAEDSSSEDDNEDDEKKKPQSNHSLEEVEKEFAAVMTEFNSLKVAHEEAMKELESLRKYKENIENQRKDAEIAKYYMLNDEDKADIIAHKSEYTLDEIKSKLAVLYVEKNVDFSLGEEDEEEVVSDAVTTFSLDSAVEMNIVSPMVQSLLNARNN